MEDSPILANCGGGDLLGHVEVVSRRSLGSHQSSRMQSDVWLTPPHILRALGTFDLDPCAPAIRPWDMAREHICLPDNGLMKPWHGRVWLNPPFGDNAGGWLHRLADHGNGIALVHARTETEWFFRSIWRRARGILFIEGRLTYCRPNGQPAGANSGAPSVLVAYGDDNAECLRTCGIAGQFIELTSTTSQAGLFG